MSYKSLCEKKIQEFIPYQTFPLKPEDLKEDSLNPASDLSNIKREIDKLNEENRKLKTNLIKLNRIHPSQEIEHAATSLREILRGEIIDSEEQKSYIEILKEALETRIDELNLRDFLIKSKEEGLTPAEQFAQLIVIQKDIEDRYNIIKEKENEVNEMEILVLDLKKENENQAEEIKRLQSEYSKIVEEKTLIVEQLEELNKKVRFH